MKPMPETKYNPCVNITFSTGLVNVDFYVKYYYKKLNIEFLNETI